MVVAEEVVEAVRLCRRHQRELSVQEDLLLNLQVYYLPQCLQVANPFLQVTSLSN
jgi:hypothetical protein